MGKSAHPKCRVLTSYDLELKTSRDIDRLDWGDSFGPFGPVEFVDRTSWSLLSDTHVITPAILRRGTLLTKRVTSFQLRGTMTVGSRSLHFGRHR